MSSVMKAVVCPRCKGTGKDEEFYIIKIALHPSRCPKCKGKGWVEIPNNMRLVK